MHLFFPWNNVQYLKEYEKQIRCTLQKSIILGNSKGKHMHIHRVLYEWQNWVTWIVTFIFGNILGGSNRWSDLAHMKKKKVKYQPRYACDILKMNFKY